MWFFENKNFVKCVRGAQAAKFALFWNCRIVLIKIYLIGSNVSDLKKSQKVENHATLVHATPIKIQTFGIFVNKLLKVWMFTVDGGQRQGEHWDREPGAAIPCGQERDQHQHGLPVWSV